MGERTQNSTEPGILATRLAAHRKDAVRSVWRLLQEPFSTLMTVLVVGIALLLPVVLMLVYANLEGVLAEFQSSARITLYLEEDTTESEGIELSEYLLTLADTELTAYVSPSQALAEFSSAVGFGGSLSELADNPLPATIIVRPTPAGMADVERLAAELGQLPDVELVQLDSEWISRLLAITGVLATTARLASLIVLTGLCLIVGNTIKQGIDNRRAEILVVKLVGGTAGFIARPFLYAGAIIGLAGGVVACILLGLLTLGLSDPLTDLVGLYGGELRVSGLDAVAMLGVVLAGGGIGWLAALVASLLRIAALEP